MIVPWAGPFCIWITVMYSPTVNLELQLFTVSYNWSLRSRLLSDPTTTSAVCEKKKKKPYWCFSTCFGLRDESKWFESICQFYQCILGILITCLVCFRKKQFRCPLCPRSRRLLSSGRRTKCLSFINGLWKCEHFSLNGELEKQSAL